MWGLSDCLTRRSAFTFFYLLIQRFHTDLQPTVLHTSQTETTTNRFILKIQDDGLNKAISPNVTGIHWEKIASFVAVVELCLIFPQQTSSFYLLQNADMEQRPCDNGIKNFC